MTDETLRTHLVELHGMAKKMVDSLENLEAWHIDRHVYFMGGPVAHSLDVLTLDPELRSYLGEGS